MGTAAKRAGFVAHTVLLMGIVAALLCWGGREVAFTGTPDPTLDPAAAGPAWVQASIDEQVAVLGCDSVQRLSARVAVRPAQASKADRANGVWVFDTAVVTVVPFDQAFTDAKAGKVWVVGWCGA